MVFTVATTKCAHRVADWACFEIYSLIEEYHETIAIPVGRRMVMSNGQARKVLEKDTIFQLYSHCNGLNYQGNILVAWNETYIVTLQLVFCKE